MTVTVTASAASVPSPVLLDVTSAPSVTAPLTVYRVHADGTRHKVITGRSVLIGSWSGPDYHAPFNQPFHYIAATEGQPESAPSATQWRISNTLWLMHRSDPALSLPVSVVMKLDGRRKPGKSASFDILPASPDEDPLPVVRWDSRRGPESGNLQILTDDAAQFRALENLLARGPVLLNSHREEVIGWQWINPGETSWEPPGGYYRTAYRVLSFPWTACRAPDADTAPLNTYPNVKTKGGYTTVAALYDGYRALKLGIETP